MTAKNSAIVIDLTGQVSADSIGTHLYSGVDGQMDFVRGGCAGRAGSGHHRHAIEREGRHGLAHHARPARGRGRGDVARARPSGGHGMGVAELFGKFIEGRARALIAIAHPDFRDELSHHARQRFRI